MSKMCVCVWFCIGYCAIEKYSNKIISARYKWSSLFRNIHQQMCKTYVNYMVDTVSMSSSIYFLP